MSQVYQYHSKPHIKARTKLIKSQRSWWENLPKFKLGWDVFDHVSEIGGFECRILTKGPYQLPYAWTEKVQWVESHFHGSVDIDIVGRTKGGKYGHILVDDYPKYIEEWLEHRPRGLVIMPAHDYNKDFHHPNVIRYDGENILEVCNAITAVKKREDGKHWKEYL